MSTLTKTLIILLTLTSIFLCGIVVTFVAYGEDYKQKNDNLKKDLQAAKSQETKAKNELKEKKEAFELLEDKLNKEIAALKIEITELKTSLTDAEREKAALNQRVDSFASIVEGFTKTSGDQGLLLQRTLDELKKLQSEKIKIQKKS